MTTSKAKAPSKADTEKASRVTVPVRMSKRQNAALKHYAIDAGISLNALFLRGAALVLAEHGIKFNAED
jgi:hypothetical protein